jgi:hypothetical protein
MAITNSSVAVCVLMLGKGKGGGLLADDISYSCAYVVSLLDNYCEHVQLIAIQKYAILLETNESTQKQDETKLATTGQRGYTTKRS